MPPVASPGSATSPRRPIALVTGGAKRMGRAIVLDLAAHGFDVALHYRHSHREAEQTALDARALGAHVVTLAADLDDSNAVVQLVPRAVAAMGAVDALVNNASRFVYDAPASFDPKLLDSMMSSNCKPAIALSLALHAHVKARHASGAVVHLLDHKLAHPNPDYFSYTISKAALASASKMLALSLAPALRINSVSPGLTLGSDLIDDTQLHALQARAPLERGVRSDDVAAAVRFLLTAPTTTGVDLVVDAGAHLRPDARDHAFL